MLKSSLPAPKLRRVDVVSAADADGGDQMVEELMMHDRLDVVARDPALIQCWMNSNQALLRKVDPELDAFAAPGSPEKPTLASSSPPAPGDAQPFDVHLFAFDQRFEDFEQVVNLASSAQTTEGSSVESLRLPDACGACSSVLVGTRCLRRPTQETLAALLLSADEAMKPVAGRRIVVTQKPRDRLDRRRIGLAEEALETDLHSTLDPSRRDHHTSVASPDHLAGGVEQERETVLDARFGSDRRRGSVEIEGKLHGKRDSARLAVLPA